MKPYARAGGAEHLVAARELWGFAVLARNWWQDRVSLTVSVSSDDHLYDATHRWFTEGQHATPRAVEARAKRTLDGTESSKVDLYYDERRAKRVTIDGHPIAVTLEKAGQAPTADGKVLSSTAGEPDRLRFAARTREGQRAVIAMLERLAKDYADRKPGLWMLGNWGGWARRDDLPERSLESVILQTGQRERVVEDLRRFLAAESTYNIRGIPWHRGYLLEGPPGTGKTSLVRALAADLGLDIWYAPLGDLNKDTNLLQLLSEVRPRSILLLEDVDVFHAARSRDDQRGGVSMAGLLNALDGVATPHGLVTFMTTNDAGALDDALIRPGRVDLHEYLDFPDGDQIGRLFERFHGSAPAVSASEARALGGDVSTAEFAGLFQRYDDPSAAWRAAVDLARSRAEQR